MLYITCILTGMIIAVYVQKIHDAMIQKRLDDPEYGKVYLSSTEIPDNWKKPPPTHLFTVRKGKLTLVTLVNEQGELIHKDTKHDDR